VSGEGRIRLLSIGRPSPPAIEEACRAYARRRPGGTGFTLEHLPGARASSALVRKRREGARFGTRLGTEGALVVLDEHGTFLDTAGYARALERWRAHPGGVTLLVGGPEGLDPALRLRADFLWSLSPLTLPHAIVRLLVAEQTYRALCLHAGHPYHRA
jgi:23S rRNA (pseudouridine1915-N3)-methyltransferase